MLNRKIIRVTQAAMRDLLRTGSFAGQDGKTYEYDPQAVYVLVDPLAPEYSVSESGDGHSVSLTRQETKESAPKTVKTIESVARTDRANSFAGQATFQDGIVLADGSAAQVEVNAKTFADLNSKDSEIYQRIENLEGKTTRLYYGTGTAASPTAQEIDTWIQALDVEPKYAAPYSGVAVVVYRTDEGNSHVWHYYENLTSWKDDGIDTVSAFTNETAGIIKGSASDGYVSAEDGLGKVSGWNTVARGSGLTTEQVLLGNGGTGVKASGKTVEASLTSSDDRLPTSKAVSDYVSNYVKNPKITINQAGEEKASFTLNQAGAVSVALTDEKVTSAANHYAPTADSGSAISLDAQGGQAASWGAQVVTGVNVSRDSKGHVTGMTLDSKALPGNPNTWRGVNVDGSEFLGTGTSTKPLNVVAGDNVKLTSDTSAGSLTIKAAGVSIDSPASYKTISGISKNSAGDWVISTRDIDKLPRTAQSLSGTDLDTIGASLENVGFYYAGGGNNCPNKPAGVDAFGLLVFRVASGAYCQLLVATTGTGSASVKSKTYVRVNYPVDTDDPSSGWSDWQELAWVSSTGVSAARVTTGSDPAQATLSLTMKDGSTVTTPAFSLPKGPKGDAGPQGPQGEQGLKGDKGDAGPQGPKGDAGPQGPQGDKGEAGTNGEKGEKGDPGADGYTFIPSVSASGDLSWTKKQGDGGNVPATVNIKGPKGDAGDAGIANVSQDEEGNVVTSVSYDPGSKTLTVTRDNWTPIDPVTIADLFS